MLQMLIAREIETNPAVAARMKLAIMPGFNVIVPQGKLVGGTFKKTPLCSRPGETGCVIALEQLPREERPAGGRDLRHRRPARHDRRLRQSGAARRDRTGCRSTAIGTRARACRCPAGRSPGRPKGRRRRPTCAPKAWFRPNASTTASAAICRSAPTTSPARSGPTASAARSASWACSCPAGACILSDMDEAQGDLIREVGEISAQSRTAARR